MPSVFGIVVVVVLVVHIALCFVCKCKFRPKGQRLRKTSIAPKGSLPADQPGDKNVTQAAWQCYGINI